MRSSDFVSISGRCFAHHGVGIRYLLSLEAECLVGQRLKGEVAVLRGAFHQKLLQKVRQFQLDEHVVAYKHLFAGGQAVEFLDDAHVLHEVDIRTARDAHVDLADAVGGVGRYVEASRETEVLRVVGRETDLDAFLAVHHDGVFDEVAVEAYG